MFSDRISGILLHPTSLPGRYGIGDIGNEAFDFVQFLIDTGQKLWQILPLGPPGFGNSPYQCYSAFAGNILLISPDKLLKEKLLKESDLKKVPSFNKNKIDFNRVIKYKTALLKKAYTYFKKKSAIKLKNNFKRFCRKNKYWLDDYTLFIALKEANNNKSWTEWDEDIRSRQPASVRKWKKTLRDEIECQKFLQYIFFKQWYELKSFCNKNNIKIMGDIPIFISQDSCDVWAHPELFKLFKNGKPKVVAGVPPDYFSKTGQLWGNPIYNWKTMLKNGFKWWIKRFKLSLDMVDMIRLDHFRGFAAYWEVPGKDKTAMNGKWVRTPGKELFTALRKALGDIPLIAEDLGVITPDVVALREKFNFPGMKVLQFAFGNDPLATDYKPFSYPRHCVVYTGTHDNNTAIGWFHSDKNDTTRSVKEIKEEQNFVLKYIGTEGKEINWDLIRTGMSSVGNIFIFPMQDLLAVGPEGRMNLPSTSSGNWEWRYKKNMLTKKIKNRLKEMTLMYGR